MEQQKIPKLNIDKVPEEVKYELGKATYEAVKRFLAQPGGKEFLAKKTREMERMKEKKL